MLEPYCPWRDWLIWPLVKGLQHGAAAPVLPGFDSRSSLQNKSNTSRVNGCVGEADFIGDERANFWTDKDSDVSHLELHLRVTVLLV